MNNPTIIGITAALLSTMSWAACSLIFKKLGEKLEPIGMTAIKTIISTIILFIISLLTFQNLNLPVNSILIIALSGILGIAIGDSLFFAALNNLSPLILSIILFVCPDLFSGIFGLIFLNEMPSIIAWIGIFFIITGLAFIIFPIERNIKNSNKTKIRGIMFALLSFICTAYSMVLIKPILKEHSTISITMYRMIFAGTFLLLSAIVTKKLPVWKTILKDTNYLFKLTGTVSLATVGGFWLSIYAIKYINLVIASSLMSLEPLFILIFMIICYRYKPKKKELFGIFFTVLGIIFISGS